MKVKELIAKLQEFNQESEIMVNGYEGGVNIPSCIEEIQIMRDYNANDIYCGNHREILTDDNDYSDFGIDDEEFIKSFTDEGGIISKVIIIRR
jgi:hypothetical protein